MREHTLAQTKIHPIFLIIMRIKKIEIEHNNFTFTLIFITYFLAYKGEVSFPFNIYFYVNKKKIKLKI